MTEPGYLAADGRVLILAVLLDLMFGDPGNRFHPVAWLGRGVNLLVRGGPPVARPSQLWRGGAVVAMAAAASVLVACLVVALCRWLNATGVPLSRAAVLLIEAGFLKTTFAIRGLGGAGAELGARLRDHDLVGARQALGNLCSRDASTLQPPQLVAAAIESLAENLGDSVIAPLFFYALFGLPGAACYRACNTLDAMIGYHGRLEYLGKPAARLDDVLNWLPARLSAFLLLAAGVCRRANAANGLRVMVRDGGSTESPNAGRPMAAMAGLLGVVLEKAGQYRLGIDGTEPRQRHLTTAWQLVRDAALLGSALAIAATFILQIARASH